MKQNEDKHMKKIMILNICVITWPFWNMVAETILSNLIDILEPLSNELFVITGKFPDRPNKRIHIIRIKIDEKRELTIIRAIKYIFNQLRTTFNLIKISKNVEVVIFYLGNKIDTLPVLTAKLLRMKNKYKKSLSTAQCIIRKGGGKENENTCNFKYRWFI